MSRRAGRGVSPRPARSLVRRSASCRTRAGTTQPQLASPVTSMASSEPQTRLQVDPSVQVTSHPSMQVMVQVAPSTQFTSPPSSTDTTHVEAMQSSSLSIPRLTSHVLLSSQSTDELSPTTIVQSLPPMQSIDALLLAVMEQVLPASQSASALEPRSRLQVAALQVMFVDVVAVTSQEAPASQVTLHASTQVASHVLPAAQSREQLVAVVSRFAQSSVQFPSAGQSHAVPMHGQSGPGQTPAAVAPSPLQAARNEETAKRAEMKESFNR
jgi:hypothetical protein